MSNLPAGSTGARHRIPFYERARPKQAMMSGTKEVASEPEKILDHGTRTPSSSADDPAPSLSQSFGREHRTEARGETGLPSWPAVP